MGVAYRFRGELWMHQGEAAWYFVTLPVEIADEIDERTATTRRGFGSVPVSATIGSTSWTTSVFPDMARRSYLLPVKKQVRAAEDLDDGDVIEVFLDLAALAGSS